jgi:ferritin-like metal-binding protein YciE
MIQEFKGTPSNDAAIIAASQKVEHYEIASYGTLRSYASQFGLEDVVALLQATLDEEGEADKKLTDIALSLANIEAAR